MGNCGVCRRRNAELLCKKKNTNWTRQFHAWSVDAIKCVRRQGSRRAYIEKSEFNRRGGDRENASFFPTYSFPSLFSGKQKCSSRVWIFPLMNSLPDQHFYLGGRREKMLTCQERRKKPGKYPLNRLCRPHEFSQIESGREIL